MGWLEGGEELANGLRTFSAADVSRCVFHTTKQVIDTLEIEIADAGIGDQSRN